VQKLVKNVFVVVAIGILLCASMNPTYAAQSKRDSVNMSILAALTSIDPHPGAENLQDNIVFSQVYEGLVAQNQATGEYEMRVAESYTISEDGTTYTFKIRPNAKFHNGDPVKASDVVFSLKRVKGMPGRSIYTNDIEDVVALDDNTVNIVMKSKNAATLNNLSRLMILSEKEVTSQGESFGTKLAKAGTGPYFFTELDHSVAWKMEAFPDYYRGPAAIKYINWKPIREASAGLIAFESGELDWYVAPVANWSQLENNKAINSELVAANHISFISVNYERGALKDPNVRKAIAHAISKENMVYGSLDGYAVIADSMIRPVYNVGAPTETLVYEYDPAKAKEYLAKAGYPNGVDIGTITVVAGGYFEKMAQVLQADLAAVGITGTIRRMENAASLAAYRVQDYDIAVTGNPLVGDYNFFRSMVDSSMVGSFLVKFEGDQFDYKRFDRLFAEGVQEMDPVKRVAIYTELDKLVMDAACYLPMFHRTLPLIWVKDLILTNYHTNPQVFEWRWQ
jgi:peptide/nickel transport system substrate-binding protein